MKSILMAAALAVATVSPLAQGQTLNMMKSLDAPHYDGHRTTWSPSSDIINMIQDGLVALDWDGKKPLPLRTTGWPGPRERRVPWPSSGSDNALPRFNCRASQYSASDG